MFEATTDDVAALGAQKPDGAEDSEIVAFCAAARKNDLAGLALPQGSDPVATIIENGASFATQMMDAGRIAKYLAEKRHHRLLNRRIEGRCRVIIEIDGSHKKLIRECPEENN